ncbi:MAG: transglycosylase SLT domain-containing protein [Burkholderiales bacterium]
MAAANPANDPDRLRNLRLEARSLEHGEGIARDPRRAAVLYCEAAKEGDVEAQFSLGWMHANARGVPRDDGLASYFFTLAAEAGNEHAKRMLRFLGPPADMPDCMRPPPPPPVAEAPAEPQIESIDQLARLASPAQRRMVELLVRLAPEYGIHPRLAVAVARSESNFDPSAVSPKNAQGLMQLIPETSARFNVSKPFDPEQNVRGGLSYLRWLLAYFRGNVALVAAAYNAGEGTVNRFRGVPPYAETRGYVKRILEMFRNDEHPFDARVTDPSPELHRIKLVKSM